jgi:SNF2 family DNA or RNA helicase
VPWAKKYCNAKKTRWGWDFDGASNIEELNRQLRATCYVRREKKEVRSELPDVQEDVVSVEIENKGEYRRASKDVLEYIRDRMKSDEKYFERVTDYLGWNEVGEKEMMDVIEEKVRRSKRGEHLVRVSVLREIAARGKKEKIAEWAENVIESGEKLVLFAVHIPMQKGLMEKLSEYKPAHIFAEDSMEERDEQINKFREEEDCRVMIASLGAAKEGIDGLQEVCSIVGFAEVPWSPGDLDQATARLHRIGQDADMVNSYHLIANETVEEHIYSVLQEKRGVVDAVTEGKNTGKGIIRRLKNRASERVGKKSGEEDSKSEEGSKDDENEKGQQEVSEAEESRSRSERRDKGQMRLKL